MKTFQMPGQKGSIDDKGVVQWTVPYFVEDLASVLAAGKEPPLPGLIEVGRTWSDDEEIAAVGLKVEVTYEGYTGTGDPEDQPDTYDFDASLREESLVGHPDWEGLKILFDGKYDQETKSVSFPEFMDKYKVGLGGLSGTPDGRGRIKNPLFGVETYLSLASVFRRTYIRKTVPAFALSQIGTIQKSLPGGFPTPPGRDWLVMPPKISQRGGVFQITEELMMSQPGGWPESVYSFIER